MPPRPTVDPGRLAARETVVRRRNLFVHFIAAVLSARTSAVLVKFAV